MRTKTLLLTAAVFAAGIGVSMAQVYSVNAVGYVNVTVGPGYNLIANPLNGSNNVIGTVIPIAPDNSSVFVWNKGLQQFNQADTYFNFPPPDNGWYDAGSNPSTTVLEPGSAFYFVNPSGSSTLTFVGEVPQGNLTNTIVANYGFYSSIVPQSASLTSMGFPASDNMSVFFFNQAAQQYNQAITYFDFPPPDNGWYDSGSNKVEPTPGVAEGFLLFNPGATANWVRNFSVNN